MQITLAAARVNAGFTQKEAATRIGVDRSTVFKGKGNISNIRSAKTALRSI